jgi:uncharacterized protein
VIARLRSQLEANPALTRALPFLVFLGLTFCQGKWGSASPYWVYLVKSIVGAGAIWLVRPLIAEMRWRASWPGLAVGIGVFLLWIGLDGLYPDLSQIAGKINYYLGTILNPLLTSFGFKGIGVSDSPAPAGPAWNPRAEFGAASAGAWLFIVVRIVGSSCVVPPLEEVFYRSLLYRYLARADFLSIPLGSIRWAPLFLTAGIFGLQHREWLAGILCGLAYQGLVCWKKRLGDALFAHGVTNCLLGLWVVAKDAWQFW